MNRSIKVICAAALLAIALLAGCATRPPVILPSPYDDLTYKPFTVPGTATVSGSSFLVTKGGDIKRGAGRTVFLIPDTPFLRVRIAGQERELDRPTYIKLYHSGESKENYDKAWVHNLATVADVDGKFTFTKVPAGKYIIETQLFWQYMNCSIFVGCRLSDTGAVLSKQIEVTDGAVLEAQLTSVIPQ